MSLAPDLQSFPPGGLAIVVGASGGIGAALTGALRTSGRFREVVDLSRSTTPSFDLRDEASIAAALAAAGDGELDLRLVVLATGVLQDEITKPEKSWRALDAAGLAHAFAVNAVGPALVMKHALPRLPRTGKAVFAALSARVGSIGDNRLGGWYGYRASKAALNQLVRTAAVELGRSRPDALCVALHPGTVATRLSQPHGMQGLDVREPKAAAADLLQVIDRLGPADSGGFIDHKGLPIAW